MATTKNVKNYKELRTPVIPEQIPCSICNSAYGTKIRTNKHSRPAIYAHVKCMEKAIKERDSKLAE